MTKRGGEGVSLENFVPHLMRYEFMRFSKPMSRKLFSTHTITFTYISLMLVSRSMNLWRSIRVWLDFFRS